MSVTGLPIIRVLLVAPLGLLLLADSAQAQRGGCMQRQMSTQSALRSQAYALPQQSSIPPTARMAQTLAGSTISVRRLHGTCHAALPARVIRGARKWRSELAAVIPLAHLELLREVLARQEVEKLAAQIDWERAGK